MVCELCLIINENYRLLFKDEFVYAVIVREPLKEGHIMVLPRRHVQSLADLSEQESKALLVLFDNLQNVVKNVYNQDSLLVKNNGELMTEGHIHFHIIPSKTCVRGLFALYEKIPFRELKSEQELEKMKNEIVSHMSQ